LFVSHNMTAIQNLCVRTVLLSHGKVDFEGPPVTAISQYLSGVNGSSRVNLESWANRTTNGEARITELQIDGGDNTALLFFGKDLQIRIHARCNTALANPVFGIVIHDATGVPISNIQSTHSGLCTGIIYDTVVAEVILTKLSLYPGRYLLSPWIMDSTTKRDIDFPQLCAALEIREAPGPHGDLKLHQQWGKVFIPSKWKLTLL